MFGCASNSVLRPAGKAPVRPKNFLYIATDGTLFKIGITDYPAERERALKVRFIRLWKRPWARQLETSIKGILNFANVRNEWFRVSEAEMIFTVRRAVRIEDDDLAMKFGIEPSPRPRPNDPPYEPPYELPWLQTA